MIDVDAEMRAYLVGKPALTALVDQRIYALVDPPAGYLASDGPAVVFTTRGTLSYPSKIFKGIAQFRTIAEDLVTARQVYMALVDAMQDGYNDVLRIARLDLGGESLQDPETGWYYVSASFRVTLAN
jgi:hypothetical protein